MTEQLSGKVAIVTGASRGIGRAIAERLASDGAAVVVNFHNSEDQATEVVDAIERAGGRAVAVRADASDTEEIGGLFDRAEEAYDGVDIVVTNAAESIFAPHVDVTEDTFDRVFGLNVRGTFFALQHAARRVRDGGRIIVISSGGTAAGSGFPGAGLYLASKAAVEYFAASLAKEVGRRGITVNTVLPGLTDTDSMIMPPQAVEQYVQQSALGRIGQPSDVADGVAFFTGPDSHWVTGQTLTVSGG